MLVAIGCAIIIPPLLMVCYSYVKHLLKLKHYPPGPIPLPIIGNLHQLGEQPHKTLSEMSKTYGDVFSVSFGTERVLIVNSIKAAREALITRGNSFSGRPKTYAVETYTRGYKSFGFADFGPFYTTMKNIAHSGMKVFGEGAAMRAEDIVREESEYLHKRLKDTAGKSIDVFSEIGLTVSNLMCCVLFGKRYTKEDLEYKDVIKFNSLIVKGIVISNLLSYFPWLLYLPLGSIRQLKLGIQLRDKLFRRKLLEHKSTYDPSIMRDCLDVFIKASGEESILTKSNLKVISDDHIEMCASDIFVAGGETVTTSLSWALLYLLKWPQYQDQIYQEIKTKIGVDRYPTAKDRNELDITCAFLEELLRYSSVAPLGVARKSIENTEVAGYSILKNTQVIFNLWNIHHDPKEWRNPHLFNVGRFLSDEGKYVRNSQASFLPFSTGKRTCFGKSIAKMELFLILSRLLRDYKLSKPRDEELVDLEGVFGLALSPKPFNVVFTLRHDHLIGKPHH